MGNFENLNVWTRSKEFAVKIYRVTADGKFSKDYGFRDQIRRSAVSIPSNIAEGMDLGSEKQAIRHINIARGSAAELYTQLLIAKDIGYIDENDKHLIEESQLISGMLFNLIKAINRTP